MLKAVIITLLVAGAAVGATVTLLDAEPQTTQTCDKADGCEPCERDGCESSCDRADGCNDRCDKADGCHAHCDNPHGCDHCERECKEDCKEHCEVDCSKHPYERYCRETVCENHPNSEDCAYMKWCNEFPDKCRERMERCHEEAEGCDDKPWCEFFPDDCGDAKPENWEYKEDGRREGVSGQHRFEAKSYRVVEVGVVIVAPDTPLVNLNVTLTAPDGTTVSFDTPLYQADNNEWVLHQRIEHPQAGEWVATFSGIGDHGYMVHAIGLP